MLMCNVLSQRDFLCFCLGICSRDFLQLSLEREVQYKSVMSCDFVLSVVLCNPSDSICFTVTS